MRRRWWFSLTGIACIAALGSVSLADSGGDVKAGKAVYDAKCKTCHGTNGEGNPALAKTLKISFKELGSKEVQSKSDDDLKKIVTQGNGKMKPVKGLTEKQLSDLTAFVRNLKS
ncbi:MAG: cytochrome c [Acidobacteria bacterium]|nr:cytochrome c [Acidobacteriota bacterium]